MFPKSLVISGSKHGRVTGYIQLVSRSSEGLDRREDIKGFFFESLVNFHAR